MALVLSVVSVAGTMAYFSDTVTSEPTLFHAGTTEVTIDTHTVTATSDLGNMAPGDVVTGQLIVKNTGSLDGYLYGRMSYTIIHDHSDSSDLGTVLDVTSWQDPAMGSSIDPDMTLKELCEQTGVTIPGEGNWMPYGAIASDTEKTFNMVIEFMTSAGNEYQGDKIAVTFELCIHGGNY
jgi:predicted ribosomally synthesized peptide with SipW-like signal peptide